MSDILRVTTPLPGQDGSSRIRPSTPHEVNVQSIPEPKRVTQPNSQNVYTDRDPAGQLPNFESNYDKFLQLLRLAGDGSNLYQELFFTKTGFLVSSGLGEGLTEGLSEYMELLQMSQSELLGFIRGQTEGAGKFQGPLFRMMLSIFQNSKSEDVKTALLATLQKYDSMTSLGHILRLLSSNLNSIAQNLPEKYAAQLREMVDSLVEDHPGGQNAANLNILKNRIMPFLTQYISQRHDFGAVREMTAMFTLNLARYEGGSVEGFLDSLRNLMNYEEVAARFPGIDPAEMEKLFMNPPMRGTNNPIIEKMIDIISRGMAGEAGAQSRPVFENLLQSMLVNESVYMPLIHAVIPANIDGNMFFSEIWVDPEADGGREGGGEDGGRAIKTLIKFDIKNIGYFEMIILARNSQVDLHLYYPSHFESARGKIRDGITEIVRRNQLSLNSFELEEVKLPKTISEVFPKVYERKNVINVVV